MTTDLDRLIEAVESGEMLEMTTVIRSPVVEWGSMVMASFDGSIDAAVALLEALLPGRNWSLDGGNQPYAVVWTGERNWSANEGAEASNPARALLLATLRAYRSTMESDK